MRHLTERMRAMAEAAHTIHMAYVNRDWEAHARGVELERQAKALPPEADNFHCVSCGTEWDGKGRLTICYVKMYEAPDDHPHERIVTHQTHERGDENNVTFCPDCKSNAFAHTSKR